MKKKLMLLMGAVTLSGMVNAEGGYWGVNASRLDADIVDLNALGVKAGYNFNENFAIEGRALIGIGDDSFGGIDFELDSLFGGYLRAGVPVSEGFYPYAVAGYARTDVSGSAGGASASADDSDFSYGVGVNVDITETLDLNLEYMNYYDDDDSDITAFSLGVEGRF